MLIGEEDGGLGDGRVPWGGSSRGRGVIGVVRMTVWEEVGLDDEWSVASPKRSQEPLREGEESEEME